MEGEKIICPYCGKWNGHPNGVEMYECDLIFGTDHWFKCPVCGSTSPTHRTSEAARMAALRRFTSPQKPLTLHEMRKMDGEPAWCEEIGGWGIISYQNAGHFKGIPFLTSETFAYDIAKRGFTIYKAKPERAKDSAEDQEV